VAGNGTERYKHNCKWNGLKYGTGTGTVLFCARVLTVSCPAFRKFGTVRHGMVKALDTAQNGTGTRHGTELNGEICMMNLKMQNIKCH
jgi:hypothetical protein